MAAELTGQGKGGEGQIDKKGGYDSHLGHFQDSKVYGSKQALSHHLAEPKNMA